MKSSDVLSYIFYTPYNTNPLILIQLLTEYGANSTQINNVLNYIFTEKNTLNPTIIEQILVKNDASSAKVGEAVVGQTKI